ncbi:hypothetical protein QJS10_CPA08g00430 [Acorus calamus]|uniref:Uncharacterized protein n=1 Tax=Acorus calamus TaxID=4465 RepID=A0AAV9EC44_ACOCL|nr:hypothetical protein QJS10_CPA08g00430 [Acorus calamus]
MATVYKTHLPLRPPIIYCFRQARRRASVAAVETLTEQDSFIRDAKSRDGPTAPPSRAPPEWKKLSSKELGITTSMIARPTRMVLNGLRKKGFQVYLVGGCVRDLVLKRTPKDFDIITSAELGEVKRLFSHCEIVGRRFPICHVHVDDYIVEVSSFSTNERRATNNLPHIFQKPSGCSEHDYFRWRNCLRRDFTINGLMFDPYASLIYDYMGGMEDIKKAKVRTVIPAYASFQEDCARILRAIRIAARLGFHFTKETAYSVRDLSSSIMRLDKGRLLMEMNYMLAYGSAEDSLRLLWKFGLLEILLPIQAAYFVSQGFKRRDKRSNMLLAFFSNLDTLLAPNKPCHSSLWVAILAFHQTLADESHDPLVVATFSLAVHNGGNLYEAAKIARRVTYPHEDSFSELSKPQQLETDDKLIDEVLYLMGNVRSALSMMTDPYFVSQAMAKYPQAPFSDLVCIPLGLYMKAGDIFRCVDRYAREEGFVPKKGSKIDYEGLAQGRLVELRHTFARVVFDTVYPPRLHHENQHYHEDRK